MRKLLSSATLSLALLTAGMAQAGNPAPVLLEPEVIVADTSTSANDGVIVPILAFFAIIGGLFAN